MKATILQQGPTPTPPPQVGPPKGPIIAASPGGMAALIVTGIIFHHRHAQGELADFDIGYQFEVILQTPLTLDGTRVASAAGALGGR